MAVTINGSSGITANDGSVFTDAQGNISASGSLAFTGTGKRITGDFSNATVSNRLFFQNNVANAVSPINILPNGTATSSSWNAFNNSDPTNAGIARYGVTSTDVRIESIFAGSGTYLPMTFYTGGSERMRLDTAGNLGLGAVPSSWIGVGKAIEIGDVGTGIWGREKISDYVTNTYFSATGYRYAKNGGAGRYTVNENNHSWHVAPSGTAGDAATFTQAMTLDASGNLGLGVTPSAWSYGGRVLELTNNGFLAFAGPNMTLGTNQFYNGSNFVYKTTGAAGYYSVTGGQHAWGVAGSGTAGNVISFTQAMTLDASGNLLVGTTSSVAYTSRMRLNGGLEIHGAQQHNVAPGNTNPYEIVNRSGGGFDFYPTGSTLAARIDSSGNFLVGTTTPGGNGFTMYPTGSGGGVYTIYNRPATANTTTALAFQDGGVVKGSISYTNTATSFNTSSDYRLKENIQPMTGALAKVAALKPVTYKWKADGSDGQGFIAHELQEVVPQCVTGEKDAVDAESNPVYQGIDTSFLVAILAAAIQEQQAIIQSLQARLDAAGL